MTPKHDVAEFIRDHIRATQAWDTWDTRVLNDSTPLAANGILSSLQAMHLAVAIEDEFGIEVALRDFDSNSPDYAFKTIADIERMVQRKRSTALHTQVPNEAKRQVTPWPSGMPAT